MKLLIATKQQPMCHLKNHYIIKLEFDITRFRPDRGGDIITSSLNQIELKLIAVIK